MGMQTTAPCRGYVLSADPREPPIRLCPRCAAHNSEYCLTHRTEAQRQDKIRELLALVPDWQQYMVGQRRAAANTACDVRGAIASGRKAHKKKQKVAAAPEQPPAQLDPTPPPKKPKQPKAPKPPPDEDPVMAARDRLVRSLRGF